jgi:hypothetical protein
LTYPVISLVEGAMDVATLEERMNECFKLTPVVPDLLRGEYKRYA